MISEIQLNLMAQEMVSKQNHPKVMMVSSTYFDQLSRIRAVSRDEFGEYLYVMATKLRPRKD